jgi:hypothetical protein
MSMWSENQQGEGRVSFPQSLQTCSGVHPAFCAVPIGGTFLRDKTSNREADHCPPPNAEIKN